MKSLIIGAGEVGKGLHKVIGGQIMDRPPCDLKKGMRCGICRPCWNSFESFDIIHICFPYSKRFVSTVRKYQSKYKPKYTVIHSTVPVGTSIKLNAIHSPIRGVHPYLAKGIRTFVKYFGGPNAKKVARYYKKYFPVKAVNDSDTVEALKLWDTTMYGAMILLNKEIYKWCRDNGVDFDLVYTHATKSYNDGYRLLGRPEVVRPYLKHKAGKIGGHCVFQNTKLFKSKTCKRIQAYQKPYAI